MPICKQTEFAELCHVSRASVSQSISRQKLVATPDGQIDTDHPINAAYIKKRLSDLKLASLTTTTEKPAKATQPKPSKPAKPKAPPKKQTPKKVATPQVSEDEQKERAAFQAAVAKRQAKKAAASAPPPPPAGDDSEDLDDDEQEAADDALLNGESDELTGLQIRKLLADIRNKEASTKRQEAQMAILKGEFIERAIVQRHFANLDSSIKTNLRDWPMRISAKLESMGKRGSTVADFRELLENEMTAIIARIKLDTIDKTKAEA